LVSGSDSEQQFTPDASNLESALDLSEGGDVSVRTNEVEAKAELHNLSSLLLILV
jgi:hypothetical protein